MILLFKHQILLKNLISKPLRSGIALCQSKRKCLANQEKGKLKPRDARKNYKAVISRFL